MASTPWGMTRAQLLASSPRNERTGPPARYSLLLTRNDTDVIAARRLRYQVFATEFGARVGDPVAGLDADRFDEFRDHLVV